MHVNTHIHTPYSFSAFDTIGQAVALAVEERVVVLGINDFNTVDGYEEFATECRNSRVYPVFGIEFMTILPEDQQKSLHWNDPVNPGLLHICGKGLKFPVSFSTDSKNLLASIWKRSQDRIWNMIQKLNDIMKQSELPITLDYNAIRTNYARNSVRERHLAKALYLEIVRAWSDPQQLSSTFKKLFKDSTFNVDFADTVTMQNEIRNRLLNGGQPAYIEEKEDAFLEFKAGKKIILETGGIPCYPLHCDEQVGFTDYERDINKLTESLIDKGMYAVEFISKQVTFDTLKLYARHFYKLGFCVTFGTAHNSPERNSLIPVARNDRPFDDELHAISCDGACIVAAHQELHRQHQTGFIDESGQLKVSPQQLNEFVRFGEDIIRNRTNKS